jgi:hypothetical protein
MVSPVINEQYYDGAFLVSEANNNRSRDGGYIDNATGADVLYNAGLVIAVSATGAATAARGAGDTGNGTASAVTVEPNAVFGSYTLTATSATEFAVADPAGASLGTLTVGTAFANQIGLTITAGGTAFVAGDSFTVSVTATNGNWVSWTGGTITTLAILYNRVWVSSGTAEPVAVVVRDCEVNRAEVLFDPAVTGAGNAATLMANAFAALATAGVIAR